MKRRVVRARPIEGGDTWGEGQWLVELPSSPPRVIQVMVGPFGDKKVPSELWLAKGYDRVLQVHLGGSAPCYQDALYSVVQGYQDRVNGHWPRLAWTADPRIALDPAEVDPLPSDVGETAYHEPPRRAEAPPPAPPGPSAMDTPWTPPPAPHEAPKPARRGRKAG